MGYIDEKLTEGEQVVYRTKLHAAVLIFPIIIIAIAISFFGPAGLGLLLGLLAACWLAVELAAHGASEFGVTNKRVLMKRGGIIGRKAIDVALDKVEDIQATQSFLGGKIGYGTVVVRGPDGSTSFSAVNHPLEFRDKVQEQLDRKKKQIKAR